ncbi:MAG: YfhO family protein [Firmicutes bacterium]|nr:YfhO family protein [Bacillota bacterium]
MKKFFADNKICIYSFLLPFLAMLAIFIGNGIYPFGDGSFMHSDMYHQYVPFLEEFLRKVKDGEPLYHSWRIGMGSNYLALYGYYSASPFNWLMLLVPQQFLIEFMSYMVVFKIGLCGFTFAWYLKEKFQTKQLSILFFATFYAMSGFVAAYNWNVMWMDTLVLAPLIVLGLERLVREKKSGLYCVTLGLCILSNYYLSIMVCLFLCLYALVLVPELYGEDGWKAFFKRLNGAVGRFAFYSLLAAGMASVILIPEAAALTATEFSDVNFPKKVTWYFSFFDVIARHAAGVQRETGLDHWPNIFCSSAIFFLIPLYAANRNIRLKEKVGKLLLCAFFIISFSVNNLNFIWHGLNYPDSLPARQSFLYILLVLTMCFEAVYRHKGFSAKELLACTGLGLAYLLLAQKLVDNDAFSTGIFLLTGALVALYALLLYCREKYRSNALAMRLVSIFTLACVAFEATFNMAYTSVSTTSRSSYLDPLPAYQTLAERTMQEDTDFYRFEKFSRVTKNDGALAGYPTASLFSSTANAAVESWYDRMGMSESKVFYCFDGQTPFTSALLNVRYMFSRADNEDPNLYTLIGQQDDVYLYKCNYTLPAGFLLKDGWNLSSSELEASSSDPLDLQNQMAYSLGASSPLFKPVVSDTSDQKTSFTAKEEGHYYAYTKNRKADTISLDSASLTKTFKKVKYDYILDLGRHPAGETVTLSDKEEQALDATVMMLDEAVLAQVLDTLSQQPFAVDSWDSAHVNGHVDVTQPGQLVLSIPDEPGWTLKVNGQVTEHEAYDDTFLSVCLTEGSHTIELSYRPAGLTAGIIVSLMSIAVFFAVCFLHRRKRRRSAPDTNAARQ